MNLIAVGVGNPTPRFLSMLCCAALCCAALCAASAAHAESDAAAPATVVVRPKLLVLDTLSEALPKDAKLALSTLAATHAARFGQVETVAESDVRTLMTLEADKQAAGCDESACFTEIAGALGARYVLSTRAGKVGNTFVVSAQLFDVQSGTAAARDAVEAYEQDALLKAFGPMLDGVLNKALGPPTAQGATATRSDVNTSATPNFALTSTQRMLMGAGGATAAAVGVATIGLGFVPAFLYGQTKANLATQTRAFDGSADARDVATQTHEDALMWRDVYNVWGRLGLLAGAVLVAAGGAVVAGSFFVPVTPDEDVAQSNTTAGVAP